VSTEPRKQNFAFGQSKNSSPRECSLHIVPGLVFIVYQALRLCDLIVLVVARKDHHRRVVPQSANHSFGFGFDVVVEFRI
jgi:hypothetical protein